MASHTDLLTSICLSSPKVSSPGQGLPGHFLFMAVPPFPESVLILRKRIC